MRAEPQTAGSLALSWLAALAVVCGAAVLAGGIRETWTWISGSLEVIAR